MRALEFGPLGELRQKYGNLRQIEGIPRESITQPAVVFKRKDKKKNIVFWSSDKALELWQKRHADNGELLPDVFTKKADITEVSNDVVRPNKLVLKAKTIEESVFYTMDDE
jgi:anaerobic dimethyl sulfoxide reductase subunit B (iron-sulfur subunit)